MEKASGARIARVETRPTSVTGPSAPVTGLFASVTGLFLDLAAVSGKGLWREDRARRDPADFCDWSICCYDRPVYFCDWPIFTSVTGLWGVHPTPYTPHPTPYTLLPAPQTLNPRSQTLHPITLTLNPHPKKENLY